MIDRRSLALCSLAFVVVAGCGGGSGGSLGIDGLPAAYASHYCKKAFACCSSADIAVHFAGLNITDEASCESQYTGLFMIAISQDKQAIADGTLVYDGDAAAACLDLLDTQSCTDFARSGGDLSGASCPDPFTGKVAEGQSCVNDSVCTSGYCEGDTQAPVKAGICKAPPTSGRPCPDFTCAANLRCDFTTGTETCAPLLADGMPCDTGDDCTSGGCNGGDGMGTQGTCGAPTVCDGM